MSAKGMEVTYPRVRMGPEDFVPGTLELNDAILCDVIACVHPTDDAIEVEITRVIPVNGSENLVGLLRRDVEHQLKPIMRSVYLNSARQGLEGDAHDEDIA